MAVYTKLTLTLIKIMFLMHTFQIHTGMPLHAVFDTR